MARMMINQSLITMMFSTSAKKRRSHYYSSEVVTATTKIQTGEISQAQAVYDYGIPCQTLPRKYSKKRKILAEKNTAPITVLGEAAEKDLVQWALDIQTQGLPEIQDMIIQKGYEINRYMFGSMSSVGLSGCGRCGQFMSRHHELILRMTQVIKQARNEASFKGSQSFF